MVHCVKLGREAEGLDRPPYPGDLGKRIYENASKQAWQDWLRHQTMLINENRLSPMDPKARKFLEEQAPSYHRITCRRRRSATDRHPTGA